MPKIVTAFVRAEVLETGTEERPERLAAATAGGANEGLEFREAELDGIEVRAIGWQVPERGPGGLDGALDAGNLVGPEVVGDDDVAGVQGRHQDLVDVGAEALAIDRAVEDPRCGQPRDPPRGEKRAGLPAPAGGVVVDARAARCAAIPPKQIVGAAGFVQKHEGGDVPGRRRRVPRDPRGRDVRPIVFGWPDRFFLTVRPRARTARQTVGTLAGVARASFSLASVRSGCAAIRSAKVCRCGSSMQRRPCRWTRGATSPVSRRRCFNNRTHDPLTRYFAATSATVIPASLSRSARSRRSIGEARIGPPASVRAEVPRPPQVVQGLFEKRFNALGSVTPLAISRTICIPVRPVMSVITLWSWTFIRARDFCIRRI